MNILLKETKKHLLFLIIIFHSVSSLSESILTPDPFLSISTKGFVTGKFQSANFEKSTTKLNNHGAFYGEVTPELYYNKSNFLSLGFFLENEEFSEYSRFRFSPLIYANIGNDTANSFFKWSVKTGTLPYITVGNGLTFKDFRQIGIHSSLSIKGFNSLFTLWAQGYTQAEDIFRLDLFHERFPIKLNLIFWPIQGHKYLDYAFESDQKYYSFYILPYVFKEWKDFDFYLEYGYKYKKEKEVSYLYDYSPHEAHALLFGISYVDTLFNFKITVNPEFCYYGKGFIPNTGVSSEFLGNLDTWYHSTNNWIDFFNSREKSIWLYSRFYIETPTFAGFSIYFHDELLYFHSTQKTIIAEFYNTKSFMAFNPSTNFYKAGIKYFLGNIINVSFNISNQMINIDPFFNQNIYSSQYMERFYPADELFFELLLQWKINNIKKRQR